MRHYKSPSNSFIMALSAKKEEEEEKKEEEAVVFVWRQDA